MSLKLATNNEEAGTNFNLTKYFLKLNSSGPRQKSLMVQGLLGHRIGLSYETSKTCKSNKIASGINGA